MKKRVINMIAHLNDIDAKLLSMNTDFRNDLGMDTFEIDELVSSVEKYFNVVLPFTNAYRICTVGHLVQNLRLDVK